MMSFLAFLKFIAINYFHICCLLLRVHIALDIYIYLFIYIYVHVLSGVDALMKFMRWYGWYGEPAPLQGSICVEGGICH